MTPAPRIDADLVRRLIAAQFPQWSDLPIAPVPTQGMDNATYRLGRHLSARLPRFERWVGQVEREHRWLPRLAPHLPLAISTPLAQGEPGEGYPFPWSVYRWLDGQPLDLERLPDPLRAAADLAEFIAALHAIDATDGPRPQWSNSYRGVHIAADVDSVASKQRVLPKLAALRDLTDTDALGAVWEAALAAPAWDRPAVWVHGDLAQGNLLSTDGRLSAVIDFGTLSIGDPACDINNAWMFRDPAARDVVRRELNVDDATWARARGWALAASLPVPDDPYFARRPDRTRRALRVLDDLVADLRR
ncbi:MAG TPA: aminoglycoside phosphotransferase family protein [Stackebrandtia sp.]|uniref:aminoglycoside phosphotransferase family protein n=1 Tax=Stackebrandtia sp. TaxID=2023065 RepID=UPI002D744946|nr:aminoglycoside phosphotransferase family protein [Stackebrandtia sp.]HZE39639.1 aminoglycoside phosphotransferase family protein [Stackebrandtia sp.]